MDQTGTQVHYCRDCTVYKSVRLGHNNSTAVPSLLDMCRARTLVQYSLYMCRARTPHYCSIRFLKHRDTGAAPWVASHAFIIISLKSLDKTRKNWELGSTLHPTTRICNSCTPWKSQKSWWQYFRNAPQRALRDPLLVIRQLLHFKVEQTDKFVLH